MASIAVLPSRRMQGVGNQLLRDFEERAISTNATYIRLTVEEHNSEARKAYERAGWEVGHIKDGKVQIHKRIVAYKD